MTIVRPGKKRRDPLGMHECWYCDCQFVVEPSDRLPAPDSVGDIDFACPTCQRRVTLNKLVLPTTTTPAP